MDSSTIICRCEELTAEEIYEAINQGAETFSDIKRLTRCGMGACQAKICANLVAELIQEQTGKAISDLPMPRSRPPIFPIKLGTLVKEDAEDNGISFWDADDILDEGKGDH